MDDKRMNTVVAANIKKCREIRNYTQEYVAKQLDISTTAYRSIESGKTSITVNHIFSIAEILALSVNALLYYDENKSLNVYNEKENDKMWSEISGNMPHTTPQRDVEFNNMIQMLRTTYLMMNEMVDKNSKINTDINEVALNVTTLVRELALLQKKKR